MNQVTDFPLSTAQHDPIAVARELAESFRTSAVERDRTGGNAKADTIKFVPAACWVSGYRNSLVEVMRICRPHWR